MSSNVGGHCFIFGLYAALVAVAGAAGYLTGTFVSGPSASWFLFLVSFLPTSAGSAVYGVPTIAFVPDVPLALVVYVLASLDGVA